MKPRERKGQIIIFIVLILIFAIIAIALLSGGFFGRKPAPTVIEASWRVDDREITSATVGQSVEAVVTVQATEQYVGSIVLKVRKDLSLWSDQDYAVATIPVNLIGGMSRQLTLEFVPDQASSSGFRALRGYFIEVDFSAVGASWNMGNSYPPRLTATAVPQT